MPDPAPTPATAPAEALTRWGIPALAALAAAGGLFRVLAPGPRPLADRLDQTTLLYLAAAGGLLLLGRVKALSFGDLRFELIERIREQQAVQAERLADIALVLPLLLPDNEVRHVRNLFARQTGRYVGNAAVREELRRLRSMGLVAMRPGRAVADLRDGATFDLSDYVELTELGRRWAVRIGEIAPGEAPPERAGP